MSETNDYANFARAYERKIEQLQAELDSLKAEKSMADMGFVSVGAGKEIDKLKTEITDKDQMIEALEGDVVLLQAKLDVARSELGLPTEI